LASRPHPRRQDLSLPPRIRLGTFYASLCKLLATCVRDPFGGETLARLVNSLSINVHDIYMRDRTVFGMNLALEDGGCCGVTTSRGCWERACRREGHYHEASSLFWAGISYPRTFINASLGPSQVTQQRAGPYRVLRDQVFNRQILTPCDRFEACEVERPLQQGRKGARARARGRGPLNEQAPGRASRLHRGAGCREGRRGKSPNARR